MPATIKIVGELSGRRVVGLSAGCFRLLWLPLSALFDLRLDASMLAYAIFNSSPYALI
jgi:hypothetical protein